MKKLLLLTLMCLVLGTMSVAGEVEMKIGHCMPQDSSRHKSLLLFKEYVERESGGKISVEVYPASTLGKEAELVESLKMGGIEGYCGGIYDALTPMLNLYLMPFIFPDQGALIAVAQSPIGKKIEESAEVNGIKILATGDAGSRNYTNNVRPIKTPADMKGLKMRTSAYRRYYNVYGGGGG